MFCKNCGKELDADARFCSNCGAVVEGKSLEEANRVVQNENRTVTNINSTTAKNTSNAVITNVNATDTVSVIKKPSLKNKYLAIIIGCAVLIFVFVVGITTTNSDGGDSAETTTTYSDGIAGTYILNYENTVLDRDDSEITGVVTVKKGNNDESYLISYSGFDIFDGYPTIGMGSTIELPDSNLYYEKTVDGAKWFHTFQPEMDDYYWIFKEDGSVSYATYKTYKFVKE